MEIPARTTRNDAIATGGKYRSPTFAAIKFTAHTTTTSPIEPAITHRPGALPADFSTYTASGQPFCLNRQFMDGVRSRLVSNAWTSGHANRALRRDCHFRLDDIFMPVPHARGHVARQSEIGQRGYRNVVCPPNARFEHPAAPHRYLARLAKIVDLLRHRIPSDTPHLDIDDLARAERDRRFGMLERVDALVETDRRLQLLLHLHVTVKIVPAERLLDHHQMKGVQLL